MIELAHTKSQEFNQLFEELTGIKIDNAETKDGCLFIPPGVNLGSQSRRKRQRLSELADNKWHNHLVNDKYAGWWIMPPNATN